MGSNLGYHLYVVGHRIGGGIDFFIQELASEMVGWHVGIYGRSDGCGQFLVLA
jgi:hypothetical protein